MSKRDIGFSCWKLFTINYFKFYEVTSCLIIFKLNLFLFTVIVIVVVSIAEINSDVHVTMKIYI